MKVQRTESQGKSAERPAGLYKRDSMPSGTEETEPAKPEALVV